MEEIGFLTYNTYKYKPIIKVRLVYEKERIVDILYFHEEILFQHVGFDPLIYIIIIKVYSGGK